MGSVIGAGIGAVGSIIGGQQSAKAAKQSAMIQAAAADRAGERALTGYKYLTEGAGAAPMKQYINAGTTALGHQGNTQNLMMDLLGITGYENARNGGGGGTPAPSNALADAAGGGGRMAPPLYPDPNYDYNQWGTRNPNPPPFPTWHQQASGQYSPNMSMAQYQQSGQNGQPPQPFQYQQGQNALNYYSVPGGGLIAPDGYGGVQFAPSGNIGPQSSPAYSGA